MSGRRVVCWGQRPCVTRFGQPLMGQLCLAFVGIPAPVEHPCASRTGHAYAFSFGFNKVGPGSQAYHIFHPVSRPVAFCLHYKGWDEHETAP